MTTTTKIGTELASPDTSPAACCSPLAKPDMESEDAAVTAGLFKALSDPNRVLILNLLVNGDGPVCVCDINVHVPLSQPTVSHHLKKLVAAGLLTREQRGVWAFFDIDRQALAHLGEVFRPGRRS
ncbi:MAG: metalloregulator ArsR/SmtB family transcription factor [Actinomycetota bacterium]